VTSCNSAKAAAHGPPWPGSSAWLVEALSQQATLVTLHAQLAAAASRVVHGPG